MAPTSIRSRTTLGFTLIELLVVIAIISILAAILFPVFATAREKARQSTCASNMKQLGLGLIQYVQDFDETFPCQGPGTTPTPLGWAEAVYPYVKSINVYACPDDSSTLQGGTYVRDSYAMNSNFYTGTGASAIAQSNLSASSSTVAVFEVQSVQFVVLPPTAATWQAPGLGGDSIANGHGSATGNGSTSNAWGTACPNSFNAWSSSGYGLYATGAIGGCSALKLISTGIGAHSGGANYLAADGHVKYLLPTLVSGGVAAATANTAGTPCVNAAGTGNMLTSSTSTTRATMTFSPV